MALGCLALFLLLAAGCAKKPQFFPPEGGISRFPTGEALEEGDVILARSYGLIGAMFATQSMEGGRYSHGAMIYRSGDGRLLVLNYRPTGMESPSCTPEEFFSRYNRLALLRYNKGLDQARAPAYVANGAGLRGKEAISAASRYWVERNAVQRIPPDYRLNHDDPDAFFCLELASTVFRDCGLTDPFVNARRVDEDPLLRVANELFKTDVKEIHSPSGALENPDFGKVSDWLRPDYDLREEELNEELMRVVIGDLERGLRPGKPSAMGRMKLRQIFAVYHLVTRIMFWKPKQDLPDFIDAEVIGNAYMLYGYLANTKKLASQRMREETLPQFAIDEGREATLAQVRRIVRESADCFRSKYMK